MLDVFIRKSFAARALRQPHAFAETAIVGLAVFVVETVDRVAAFDADGHFCYRGSITGVAIIIEAEAVCCSGDVVWSMR